MKKVSEDNYKKQVEQALQFLTGNNEVLIAGIQATMEEASKKHQYEKAAMYRDQISQLRGLQDSNDSAGTLDNSDIVVCALKFGKAVVAVLQLRRGQCLGVHTHTPNLPNAHLNKHDIVIAFIGQYFLNPVRKTDLPEVVIAPDLDSESDTVESALKEYWGKPIKLKNKRVGKNKQWVNMAALNAEETLAQLVHAQENTYNQLTTLKDALGLTDRPNLIECFDISHHAGSETIAACVVFSETGMRRQSYRRFNISSNCKPGDDYAAIKESVYRRYKRQLSENRPLPDIILIDGGKGQLSQAVTALSDLAVTGICCMSIAKGPKRLEGQEQVFVWKGDHISALPLPYSSPCRPFLQIIRDEAHRFAITGHRKKSSTRVLKSALDSIPGVGKKRKAALLAYFGGMAELKKASVAQISKTPGISPQLAQVIFSALHA